MTISGELDGVWLGFQVRLYLLFLLFLAGIVF